VAPSSEEERGKAPRRAACREIQEKRERTSAAVELREFEAWRMHEARAFSGSEVLPGVLMDRFACHAVSSMDRFACHAVSSTEASDRRRRNGIIEESLSDNAPGI
jgi:hypothetical protein